MPIRKSLGCPPLAAALCVAIGMATALASSVQADQIFGRARPTTQAGYSPAQARVVAERLYQAALGREGERSGVMQAAAQIQQGEIERQVQTMVASQEFRNGTERLSSEAILEQFYRGLHQRSPDATGIRLFVPRLDRRQYAGVLLEMLESSEFRESLELDVSGSPTRNTVPVDVAIDCQTRVLDEVSVTAAGRVFLAFEQAPNAGQGRNTVTGVAVDMSEGQRAVNYRCEGNRATFTYDDWRPARGADPREPIPSPSVRACLSSAAEHLSGTRVVAVALSETGQRTDHVMVFGLSRAGSVQVSCSMEGQDVVSVRRR